MNVAIDIGNTRAKLALFKGKEHLEYHNLPNDDWKGMEEWLLKYRIENVILCSTAEVSPEFESFLNDHYFYIRLTDTTAMPIQNTYRTPDTLGRDRLAAVIGAMECFPEKGCLVIDAGTCITYDLINRHGIYMGGNIAPGISMRLRAMDEFTAALPLVSKQHPDTNRGYSTETAIRAGAVWGTVMEAEGFARRFDRDTEALTVILTGGDAPLLDQLVDWNTFIEPHLVLIGLNKILRYNAE